MRKAFVVIFAVAVVCGAGLASFSRPAVQTTNFSSRSAELNTVSEMIAFARSFKGRKAPQAGPNCFGTTLAAVGALEKPRFASDLEIRHFLKECVAVEDARAGDIGLIVEPNPDSAGGPATETHSFVYLSPSIVFYKNGLETAGKYLVTKLQTVVSDFNVDRSQASCEKQANEAVVETGLPCPTALRVYRCALGKEFDPAQGFSTAESLSWKTLLEVDALVTHAMLETASPTPQDLKRIALLSAQLAQRLNSLEQDGAAIEPNSSFALGMTARLDSILSFFQFYADSALWPQREIAPIKRDLEIASKTIRY